MISTMDTLPTFILTVNIYRRNDNRWRCLMIIPATDALCYRFSVVTLKNINLN